MKLCKINLMGAVANTIICNSKGSRSSSSKSYPHK